MKVLEVVLDGGCEVRITGEKEDVVKAYIALTDVMEPVSTHADDEMMTAVLA